MTNFRSLSQIAGAVLISWCCCARASDDKVVSVPSKAGRIDGIEQKSDEFMWRKFVEAVTPANPSQPSPVMFETWASDEDTFALTPRWPSGDGTKRLHASLLQQVKSQSQDQSDGARAASISVECKSPGNGPVGGFPTIGSPPPCIAEEVRRNRSQFNYIVDNKLNSRTGLAAAYANSFVVDMPVDALAVKVNWVPYTALLAWLPQLQRSQIEQIYYTTNSSGIDYALVSMHISSRQNPNWVWATFEHYFNPGRCDSIGCSDSFGAGTDRVQPNQTEFNSQYGLCPKTQQLSALLIAAGIRQKWENYCLKGSQTDFVDPSGAPTILGNSVIEGIVGNGTVSASSCISCHYYASYGPDGSVGKGVRAMLPFNPSGPPVPGVLAGSRQYHFMWGVLFAP